MAEQSAVARAIVDAFSERYEHIGPFDDWVDVCLAAALRTLADHKDLCTLTPRARRELHTIADELLDP